MKRQFQKMTCLILILLFSLTNLFAQASRKEILDNFFSIYSKDPVKAIEYGFSTNKWMDRKQDEITSMKNKLKNLVELLGDYYGYDLLSEKTAGQNITLATYIIRYEREPIRFTFLFYKPKDKWQLNNFSYDESIDQDLEEAAKAYRLKENNLW